MQQPYTARPWHLLFPMLVMLFATYVGTASGGGGWTWFGIVLFLLGVGTWVWILFAGMWESYARYWDSVTRFAETMKSNRNPQLWAAFGFSPPPESFKMQLEERPEKHLPYGTTHLFDLPGTEQQFRQFADGVLMGQTMAEGFWSGKGKVYSVPEFRELKRILEERHLIRPKSLKDARQGFVLTKKGRDECEKYASPGILASIQEQFVKIAPPDRVNQLEKGI